MRPCFLSVVLLPTSLWTLVAARLHNSLVPEDPYAFPKYRVTFLNGLPVLNETAQRWLEFGLRGGELEFLDHPWEEDAEWRTPAVKSIEGGEQVTAANVSVLPWLLDSSCSP
jgi:protein OS-9